MIIFRWLLSILITLFMLSFLLIAFLLTPYGFKSTFYMATRIMPGRIHYATVDGLLAGPITIERLNYEKNGTHLYVHHLEFNWNPLKLFDNTLDITQFTLNGVRVIVPKNNNAFDRRTHSKESLLDTIQHIKSFEPEPLKLPLSVQIHNTHLSDVKLGSTEGNYHTIIKTADINGSIIPHDMNLVAHIRVTKPRTIVAAVHLTGNIKHYTLNVDLKDHLHHVALMAKGNKNGATITVPKNQALGGSIQGLATLTWYPQLTWDTQLNMHNMNLKLLYPQLPKVMALALQSHGQLDKGIPNFDLTAQVNVNKASAQLNIHYHKIQNATWTISIPDVKDIDPQFKFNLTQLNITGQLLNNNIMTTVDIGQHAMVMTANAHYDGKNWTGQIVRFAAQHNKLGNWTLKNPANFSYSKENFSLQPLCLNQANGAFLCVQANQPHSKPWTVALRSKNFDFTSIERKTLLDFQITSKLSMDIDASGVGDDISHAQGTIIITPGVITYLGNDQTIDVPIRHSMINFVVNKTVGLQASGLINLAISDMVKINLSIPSFTDDRIPMPTKPLHSNLDFKMQSTRSLTLFNHVLKFSVAEVNAHLTVDGTIGTPKFLGDATLKIPSFEYTTALLHAQNSTAHIHADGKKITYDLTGYAFNKAPIYLKGTTDLTSSDPVTRLVISTNNAELIKNNQLDVTANGTTTFLFTPESLDISGNILITQARITPIDFSSTLEMPKGNVVYIGLPQTEPLKEAHKTTLDLKIQLGNDINFKGYGIQAKLAGGIVLTLSAQQTLIANGQVHIVSGTFQAYGQKLLMDQGSSISFIQSPITNPSINARGYKRISTTSLGAGNQLSGDTIIVGVQVQGTIHNMKFSLYSQPSGLSQADILSYLVLGYASSNANSASFSVLLDAANAMATSGNNIEQSIGFVDRLKQSLGIKELGISNETVIDAIGNPIQDQSSFVVGDQISKNIYIRYRRGMTTSDNIFTVEYHFNKNWYVQTTASSGGSTGTGADIIYQIDTN